MSKKSKQTPLTRQYNKIKKEYSNSILFFQVGDFYEVFYDDAKTVSDELDIALTSRKKGQPMAGVPLHSVQRYLRKLVEKGYRVAICNQVEEPQQGKKIVKREVVKVVTPGTYIGDEEETMLLTLFFDGDSFYYSYVDISIGDIYAGECTTKTKLLSVLEKLEIKEIVCPENDGIINKFLNKYYPDLFVSRYPDWDFDWEISKKRIKNYFNVVSLVPYGIDDNKSKIISVGILLKHIENTQKGKLHNICNIENEEKKEYLSIDAKTWRNLEIFKNIQNGTEKNTLYEVLNENITPMGRRTLRRWMRKPLMEKQKLQKRWKAVDYFVKNREKRETLMELLVDIPDFERAIGRISYTKGKPRDLLQIKEGLCNMQKFKDLLNDSNISILEQMSSNIKVLNELYELLDSGLKVDGASVLGKGNLIKDGFDDEVDRLRKLKNESKDVLLEIEKEEKEKTGIETLKVKYNKVFGYFIEVTKSNIDKVPDRYQRKQTLKNAERYFTDDLKEIEVKILSADEKIKNLENELFFEIKDEIISNNSDILQNAKIIGKLDNLINFANISLENGYVKPEIVDNKTINIEDGRHPVIETLDFEEPFIPNDLGMDPENKRSFFIITGPNMAGKSTYLRQNALILLMAQIGSFVPAKKMEFGIVDKIFSRVGASDNLAQGESTFMVEMLEASYILHNATDKSFIVLDEIGRGTSTFDGLSLAWAISEYIYKNIKAKTLFATHYHELTELEDLYEGIKNLNILIKEWDNDIIFLRKIEEGRSDKSYGVHVARLAGLPENVINRAKDILFNLEEESYTDGVPTLAYDDKVSEKRSNSLFDSGFKENIINRLKFMDLNSLTPVELMYEVEKIKEEIEKNDKET
ncbi:MAG: DNA mismatch repair protein MutS [Candidatus Mcinerneyibacterium aminivorans]|uniref:DNA mismatch repair protein MutS n=1 Tax=Candidatus Mcinerneyibacterium aminivorans TaxID=2703815 RepID=A0A5D0MKB8_9BACT|nr:MAG: DNA mismatch repair protein MutS [Candidatus Mcinerneyibacterium aminivorans]